MLTPHFVVIVPMFYSMARSRMQFADIYHYVGRSDSLGIIPYRRLKVGLVKSWRRPIPCRSALDRWFDLRSHTGRIFKPFVSAVSSGAIATVSSRPYGDSRGFFSFDSLHFALMPPILDSMARSLLIPWLVPS